MKTPAQVIREIANEPKTDGESDKELKSTRELKST